MKAQMPALPVETGSDAPVRYWYAAVLVAAAASWVAMLGAVRLIAAFICAPAASSGFLSINTVIARAIIPYLTIRHCDSTPMAS